MSDGRLRVRIFFSLARGRPRQTHARLTWPIVHFGTSRRRNLTVGGAFSQRNKFKSKESAMRGLLLWLVGLPIPIIILLYLFNVL